MNPSAAGSQQCVPAVSVARAQALPRTLARAMLCVRQLSSVSVDARCLFYRRLLCQKQNAGLWPMVANLSRGEGVGRSDESSFRNEQGCFCAKFRVLRAPRGSLRVLGLIGPAAGQAVLVSDRFTATSSRRDAARHCWTASAPGVAHTLLAGPTSQPAGALNKDAQRPRPRAARQHDADEAEERPRRQPRLHEPAPRPRPPARSSVRQPL